MLPVSILLNSVWPHDRLAHDDALGPGHAGLRAELRVAALDQLPEQRRIQTRADGIWSRLELAGVAVERLALPLVVVGDVDDERRRDAVVDEVVADPLGLPRLAGAPPAVRPQAAVEHRFGQHRARGRVIGMAIDPVRRGDHARAMPADERDGVVEMRGILADPAIGPAQILAPRRAEHLPRRLRLLQPLLDRAVAAHLAGRQIAQADAEAERGVARDVPPRPISRSSGCGPKTRRSTAMAREAEMAVGRLELVEVMAQQHAAGEIGAGHAVARIAERKQMMREIAVRSDVRQAVRGSRVRRVPAVLAAGCPRCRDRASTARTSTGRCAARRCDRADAPAVTACRRRRRAAAHRRPIGRGGAARPGRARPPARRPSCWRIFAGTRSVSAR